MCAIVCKAYTHVVCVCLSGTLLQMIIALACERLPVSNLQSSSILWSCSCNPHAVMRLGVGGRGGGGNEQGAGGSLQWEGEGVMEG